MAAAPPTRPRRVFVVGTGTDVGKTHVACALLYAAIAGGLRAVAFKPIATGVALGGDAEDAVRHARALGAAIEAPLFSFEPPVSPHLAAREAGRPITTAPIVAAAERLERGADLLLVEGAGGLFSPLGPGLDSARLAVDLAPAQVLLVAPDRLGVLHDLSATLIAARTFGLDPIVVFSSAPVRDASTGKNAVEARALGLCTPAGVFPRDSETSPATQQVAARVLAALGFAQSSGGDAP